jgi:hypothetical protein
MCSPHGMLGYKPNCTYSFSNKCSTYPFSDKCHHRSTQLSSQRSMIWRKFVTHGTPCGILEATPSRNTRVNSLDMSSCALHMGRWVISPTALIPSRISVITDQINSVTEEYDLENVSGSCKHQHSLSAREAFSATPSLS